MDAAPKGAAGFLTTSAGNHGLAVAWNARRLGAPCTVWVPEDPVRRKVDAIRALGATVEEGPVDVILRTMLEGGPPDDPRHFVQPFMDERVVAGAGTVGLELAEDVADVRTVIVPVGGGGLATGVRAGVRARRPNVRIVAVQAEACAPFAEARRVGHPVSVTPGRTIADGTRVPVVFEAMWPALAAIQEVVTVGEADIRRAMGRLARDHKIVAEGSAALAAAAYWQDPARYEGPVVAMVSGGNVDPSLLAECVRET